MNWYGLEGTLEFQTPPQHGQTPSIRLLQALSSLVLNISRDGGATASLGKLGQDFSTLTVRNFLSIFKLNLLSFSLKPPFPITTSPKL